MLGRPNKATAPPNGAGPAYDRWAFERAVLDSDLPANARLLAFVLASVLPAKSNRRKGMKAGEGQRLMETLASETGLSRRTLFRACAELEAAGFLSRLAQSGRRGRRSSIFRLHAPAKCHPDTLGECHPDTLGQCHSGTQYRVLEGGRSRGLNAEAERALREARAAVSAA